MSPLKHPTQGGFTLLELLAAVALLGVGFAIFLNAMGYTTKALTQDNQTTHMALLAKSVFDEQTKGLLKPGHWEGKIDEVNWQLTSTLAPGKSSVELYRLELALEQGPRQERFTTLRVQGRSSVQAR